MTQQLRKSIFPLLVSLLISGVASAGNYNTISNKEIKSYYKNLPFEMENIKVPVFKKNEVRITEFGAVGDGVTLNTLAFEKAIKHITTKGGGTIIIPEGIWLTGPITLVSNIHLFTEQIHLLFSALTLISTRLLMLYSKD